MIKKNYSHIKNFKALLKVFKVFFLVIVLEKLSVGIIFRIILQP